MIRLAGRRLGVALVLSVGLWIAGLWVGARWIYYELPMLVAAAIKDPIYDPTRFSLITLRSPQLVNPTTLQFGPDGALYVGTRNGLILRLTLSAMGSAIHVTSEECIGAIQEIPNHDDDGHLQPEIRTRLVTGIAVTGTASNPVLYVSSSDPRIDQDGTDTNSGVLSRLDRGSEGWKRTDLVRGLPRSRSDHAPHGIALDPVRPILYLTVGSNTNLGAPSHPFRLLPEYSLSASILSIDLARIGDTTYDLPPTTTPTGRAWLTRTIRLEATRGATKRCWCPMVPSKFTRRDCATPMMWSSRQVACSRLTMARTMASAARQPRLTRRQPLPSLVAKALLIPSTSFLGQEDFSGTPISSAENRLTNRLPHSISSALRRMEWLFTHPAMANGTTACWQFPYKARSAWFDSMPRANMWRAGVCCWRICPECRWTSGRKMRRRLCQERSGSPILVKARYMYWRRFRQRRIGWVSSGESCREQRWHGCCYTESLFVTTCSIRSASGA